jgi:hypothetical protein
MWESRGSLSINDMVSQAAIHGTQGLRVKNSIQAHTHTKSKTNKKRVRLKRKKKKRYFKIEQ